MVKIEEAKDKAAQVVERGPARKSLLREPTTEMLAAMRLARGPLTMNDPEYILTVYQAAWDAAK